MTLQIALIALVLLTLAFWRSLLRVLLAVLLALLLLGGLQMVRMISTITAGSSHQLSAPHSATQSTIADGSLGVGTLRSITFTRNSTAKLRV